MFWRRVKDKDETHGVDYDSMIGFEADGCLILQQRTHGEAYPLRPAIVVGMEGVLVNDESFADLYEEAVRKQHVEEIFDQTVEFILGK